MTLTATTISILFLGGFVAGFIDSIAGGGGMISLPLLLTLGLPPHLALGTNKLQSSFGSFTAAWNYRRNQLVSGAHLLPGVIATGLFAAAGTLTIQKMPTGTLQVLAPILLAGVFIYTLLAGDVFAKRRKALIPLVALCVAAGAVLGFYDGFFGPGTGSFWTLAFVLVAGLQLKEAIAHTKVMNFTSNFVSLGVFLLGGNVVYNAGLTMALGQITGAFIGSRLVIVREFRIVRVIFLAAVALMIVKLIISLLGP